MSHSNARGPRVFATLLPPNAHRSAEKSEQQLKQLNQEDVENIRKRSSTEIPIREIHVRAIGEQRLNPDKVKLVVVIANQKETAEEVKASVTRREEYVLQSIKNQGVGEDQVDVSRSLTRQDDADGKRLFRFSVQITAFFADLHKCETLSNLLVEKLDPSTVKVIPPEVVPLHPQRLADLRRETCLLAVHNAKQKAAEIAKHFGPFCSLGAPISIKEEEVEEWNSEEQVDESRVSLTDLVSRHARHVRCSVSAIFELRQLNNPHSVGSKVHNGASNHAASSK